jgi:hypothetical protein
VCLLCGASALGTAVAVGAAGGAADDPCRVRLACAGTAAAENRRAAQKDERPPQQPPADARAPEAGQRRYYEGAYDLARNYGRGAGRTDQRTPRAHEWDETQAFMERFAPRRHAALEQMPEGESKEQMKRFWFARYRSLQALQRRDATAYEQRLSQLRVEDQIFGIVSDWSSTADPNGEQLRETLRGQVSQLVDLDLLERQRRVEWLKRELADQSEQLDRAQKQRDTLVEQRVSRFADWAGRWAARRRGEAEKRGAGEPQEPKEASKDKEPIVAPDPKKGE